MNISQDDFYEKIASFQDSRGVSEPSNFHEVPDHWHVLLTDVKGSTQAIREGRYKDVNLVGASAIAAILNLCRPLEIPYVFGGDGASFVVPSSRIVECMSVLKSVEAMSLREFKLHLRVGSVSVGEIRREGVALNIGKQALSEHVNQAIFSGGGLAKAEELIKKREIAKVVTVEEMNANYAGLECRWQPLVAEHGEIISVLVKAEAKSIKENFRIYQELIEEVEAITGGGQLANPVTRNKLKLTLNPNSLRKEQRIRTTALGAWKRFSYFAQLVFNTILGKIFFYFNLKVGGTDWSLYKDELAKNSDFWKFDDMLRFVVDVSAAQRRALEACFELRYLKQEICYGVHTSSSALLTCLVFGRQGDHLHFIDGGNGGYAMAAFDLKKRIKDLKVTI